MTNFNSHFWSCCLAIFESKNKTLKAVEHLSWMTFQPLCWPMLTLLPSPHRAMLYAAECGQRLFESNKVHAPRSLKSDSYCDSDDKTQPVQLLVKQRSGSQSVDRLAEAPQSFAHDSKHCNHPNPLLSRPNNQSESNRNNNHKAQCKS